MKRLPHWQTVEKANVGQKQMLPRVQRLAVKPVDGHQQVRRITEGEQDPPRRPLGSLGCGLFAIADLMEVPWRFDNLKVYIIVPFGL